MDTKHSEEEGTYPHTRIEEGRERQLSKNEREEEAEAERERE